MTIKLLFYDDHNLHTKKYKMEYIHNNMSKL